LVSTGAGASATSKMDRMSQRSRSRIGQRPQSPTHAVARITAAGSFRLLR
jgi:hypothetical protein